mgnify:CR=1 FL=1
MRANYLPRIDLPGCKKTLSRNETRIALAISKMAEEDAQDEVARMSMVVMGAFLLALHRRYRFGPRVLKEIFHDAVLLRAEAKTFYRDLGSGGTYEERRTGENVEDYGVLEELRKIGVDLQAWDDEVDYDRETGHIEFKEADHEAAGHCDRHKPEN